MKAFSSLLALLTILCIPSLGYGQVLGFQANLTGAQEVPPVATISTGSADVTFDAGLTTAMVNLTVFDGIGVTQAHMHCAAAGANGPVVAFLFGFVPAGVDVDGLLAQLVLTDADIIPQNPPAPTCGMVITDVASLQAAMMAGKIYANVHTLFFPGGEIRGQLLPRLSSSEELDEAEIEEPEEPEVEEPEVEEPDVDEPEIEEPDVSDSDFGQIVIGNPTIN